MPRLFAQLILEASLALIFLGPARAQAQTASFSSNSVAKASVATGDSASGKVATVTPDLFTGTFSYAVPIELPTARGDMQPDVLLRYRSISGSRWLGMGWVVDLGAVERSSRFGIRYDGDEFVLKDASGMSDLMRTASGEYRRIIEDDFARVRKLVAADGQPYFEVTTHKGAKYTYGQSAASREYDPRAGQSSRIFRWCLDRIEDPNGNFVTLSYWREASTDLARQGVLYADRIDYGGGTSQTSTGYVKFYWESRSDVPLSYATSFPVRMGYRLRTIEVRAGGALVRAYRLGYLANGPNTDRALLGSIQQFGSDAQVGPDGSVTGNTTMPATSFTYHPGGTLTDSHTGGPVRYISGTITEAQHDIGRVFTGDFDGDGRTDVAFINGWNGPTPMDVYYGEASGLPATAQPGPTVYVPGDHEGLLTFEYRVKTGDFNGDGRTDIAILEGWCQASPGPAMTIYYAKASGRGFEAGVAGPPVNTACDHEGARIDASRVLVGDFNGDGRSDFLIVEGWDSAAYGNVLFPMKLYLSDPNAPGGFAPPRDGPGIWLPGDYAGMWDVIARIKLGDFNGDGKTDVAYVEGWQTWAQGGLPMSIYYANEAGTGFTRGDGPVRCVGGDHDAVRIDAGRIIVGDFNGDGKTDFIAADGWNGGPTPMNLYLSNGAGFDPPSAVGPALVYPGDYAGMYDVIARFKVGDFNGDGKTDLAIVEGWSGGNEMSIYLSTGSGFMPRRPGPVRYMSGFSHETVRQDAARVLVGDINGDGKSDLAAIEGWMGSFPMSVYLSPASPPDLLATISNSRGGSTRLDYLSSSAYANTQLPLVIQTLSAFSTDITGGDGTVTTAVTSFAYSGGYFHFQERDFRGFAYARMTDPPGAGGERLVRETWFHQGNGTLATDGKTIAAASDDPSAPSGFTKGKPWRKVVSDYTAPSRSVETLTTYWADAVGAAAWPDADGAAPWFTPERRTESTTWDAGVATLRSATELTDYDGYGNVKREEHYGDLASSLDDRTIVRTFQPNTQAWIVALPATEDVYQGTTKLAGKWFYYDGMPQVSANASEAERRALCANNTSGTAQPTKGNPTRVVSWLYYCDQAAVCTEGPHPEIRKGYDELGNVVCARTERGGVTTIQYDTTATYPRIVNNPLGHQTETVYYGIDTVPVDFGLYGQVKYVIDSNLAMAEVRYDALGRKTREVTPGATTADGTGVDLAITTWSYSTYAADGRQYIRSEVHSKPGPISAIGTLDATSRLSWSESYLDGAEREVKSRKPGADGKVVVGVRRIDARGAVVSQSAPFFETGDVQRDTSFAYDAFGKVTSTTSPRGTVTECYSGGVTVKVDENRHRKRETRDANGSLVRVEEYRGTYPLPCDTSVRTPYAITQYTYDPLGRLTLVTDAKGNKTEVRYDSIGRKRYLHDPDTGESEYRYDLAGNLVWQQDANLRAFAALPGFEKAITFEYDLLSRTTRKVYPDGNEVAWQYDLDVGPADATLPPSAPVGRPARMTDPSGSETFRYDSAGRVTRSIKTVSSFGTYTLRTDYDALGRATRLVYPTGDGVSFGYDSGGNLIGAGSYVTFSSLNALGQPRFAVYGNGVKTEMTYHDATSRLLNTLTIDSPTDAYGAGTGVRRYVALTHGYDGAGNVTSITDGVDAAGTQTLHYDELNRLDSAQSQSYGARTFDYDQIGNITLKDGVIFGYSTTSHTLVGSVGDRPHAVLTTSGDTAPGRIRTVDYDLDNRPASITRQGLTTSFTYDGAANRVKKTSLQGATAYVKGLVECTAGTCGIYIVAGGTRIALKTGADVKYYHQNHTGSTVLVTGASGTALEQIAYRPYGETASDTGSVSMNHKFTGQERDAETEFYYYGARYYDPALGRFISPDSVVPDPFDPQMLNRYAYARNNPLSFVDPTGHEPVTLTIFGTIIAIDTVVIYYTVSTAVITAATLMAVGNGNMKEGFVRTRDKVKKLGDDAGDVVRSFGDKVNTWENDGKDAFREERDRLEISGGSLVRKTFVPAPRGPPPMRPPGGGEWRWAEDLNNSRRGTWKWLGGDGAKQPSASWDPYGRGHWDVDNGYGSRTRYDRWGNPLSSTQAHGPKPFPGWLRVPPGELMPIFFFNVCQVAPGACRALQNSNDTRDGT